MRIIETKVYTIDEHPNKEKCYEWIRNNWHNLIDYTIIEVINSLKSLQEIIGGSLDYSISAVPDRGEFISFSGYDAKELDKLNPDDCPLTGVYCDYDVINAAKEQNMQEILTMVHKDTEYVYSNDGLYELCMGNEYEFTEEGKII